MSDEKENIANMGDNTPTTSTEPKGIEVAKKVKDFKPKPRKKGKKCKKSRKRPRPRAKVLEEEVPAKKVCVLEDEMPPEVGECAKEETDDNAGKGEEEKVVEQAIDLAKTGAPASNVLISSGEADESKEEAE